MMVPGTGTSVLPQGRRKPPMRWVHYFFERGTSMNDEQINRSLLPVGSSGHYDASITSKPDK
jgi:hypothetical protein